MTDLVGQTLGGYAVLEQLGAGGMGAVFKARQPVLDRIVALKVIAPQMAQDAEYVARFQHEAKSAARLNHSNIVQVYAAGEDSGTHFMVTEFVEGESLQQRLSRDGRMDPQEALAICVFVAEGLKHAWDEAQIIHRDIKPANIFLSNKGAVKVGDLGLAKSVGSNAGSALTQSGMTMGTPFYCSPEQAQAEKNIDFRADIYSLGCTLYHMLSGKKPYESGQEQSPMSIMVRQIHDPPPAILKVLPTCPLPVVLLLNKMLAKHPSGRHGSYDELIADMRRVHDMLGQPQSVAPVSPVPTGAAAKKKSPAIIWAATAGVAVLLAAGLFVCAPWKDRSTSVLPPAVEQEPERKEELKPPAAAQPNAEAVLAKPPEKKPEAVAEAAKPITPVAPTPTQITTTAPAVGSAPPGQPFVTSIGMELVYIPPGEFMMGSTKEEKEWSKAQRGPGGDCEGEQPLKTVIKQGFWMGRTEVTVGQWKQFAAATGYRTVAEKEGYTYTAPPTWRMEVGASWKDPHFGASPQDNHPVCCITWNDAVAFCEWLNEREQKARRLPTGYTIRLPAEAEWEYACRAGTQTTFWWGDAAEDGEGRCNLRGTADGFEFVSPVDFYGARGRNKFGLADMLGNVSEWCLDEWDENRAHQEVFTGNSKHNRVGRGGNFFHGAAHARCAARGCDGPVVTRAWSGFRAAVGRDFEKAVSPTLRTPAAEPRALSATPKWASEPVIEGVGWGEVKLGMSEQDLFILLGNPDGRDEAYDKWRSSQGTFKASTYRTLPGVTFLTSASRGLFQITFNETSKAALQSGVRMGSTMDEVSQKYGRPNRTREVPTVGVSTDDDELSVSPTEYGIQRSTKGVSFKFSKTNENKVSWFCIYRPHAETSRPVSVSTRVNPSLGQGTGPTTLTPAATAKAQTGQPFITSSGMELVYIPPGEFLMGSTPEERAWALQNGGCDEKFVKREGEAPRKTTIKQGFWLGRTEVSVGQWRQFVAATSYVTDVEKKGEAFAYIPEKRTFGTKAGVNWKDPSYGFKLKDNHPVSCISWNDAMAFCVWLTEREAKAGRLPPGYKVRLPTEAEWEYACRAGTQTKFWWGETTEGGDNRLNWGGKNDGFEFVSPIDHYGARGRNKFGLADMLGNVSEWCLDEFDETQAHEECYKGNPGGRVFRGGSYMNLTGHCRCACRDRRNPSDSGSGFGIGFRVCVGIER